ncbi:hypothetical protein JHK87_051868 [Glycine soja]|nr:hypothetical protein JHK87_051868 [Glycine soja]
MILSVLSSPALVSGLMVARAKNPVHSVLFPIPVFRDTSGLLLLLGLDFSAMIFPVVHIGAIAVSFLFVVMMFHIQIAEIHEEVLRYLPVSGIIGLILWWEMFFILDNETIPLLPTQRNTTSLRYTVYAGKVVTGHHIGEDCAMPPVLTREYCFIKANVRQGQSKGRARPLSWGAAGWTSTTPDLDSRFF